MIVGYIGYAVGIVGVAFGVTYYLELRKWARQCQRARIAIAHNRRVQLNAPLVEWLTWANMLTKEEATGRVIYRNNHVSVSILRPDKTQGSKTTTKTVRRVRRARKTKVTA